MALISLNDDAPFAEITKVDWGYSIKVSPTRFTTYECRWWRPTEKWARKTAQRLVNAEKRRIANHRNPERID